PSCELQPATAMLPESNRPSCNRRAKRVVLCLQGVSRTLKGGVQGRLLNHGQRLFEIEQPRTQIRISPSDGEVSDRAGADFDGRPPEPERTSKVAAGLRPLRNPG